MPNTEESTLAVLGENLRRLRRAKKLSQGDLAQRAGLSRVGYRNIETGGASPKADTLARLAKSLDVGLDDLVRPVRRLSSVRFRARKRMTTREAILADVARWLEGYAFVEDLLGEREPFALEAVTQGLPRRRDARPIEAARKAREALGIGAEDSIRDICGLLEDHGIKVFAPAVVTDQFFGLSVGREDGGPAIVVNTWERITVERWIFTAAHELGHLLLHAAAYDVDRTEEPEDEEREADVFASHFLMPEHVFQKELREARGLSFVEAVMKLKVIFRVSWKTVVYRIASDQPERKAEIWARFYAAHRRQYGRPLKGVDEPNGLGADEFHSPAPASGRADEPEQLQPSVFREDRLRRLVRQALDEERVSLSRAAEMLDVSTSEMREIAASWLE